VNDIQTWTQGHFVESSRTQMWSERLKNKADEDENLRVRSSETENCICICNKPEDAKWIASRLNLASILEQMTHDYATGKTDGSEIVEFVRKKVNAR